MFNLSIAAAAGGGAGLLLLLVVLVLLKRRQRRAPAEAKRPANGYDGDSYANGNAKSIEVQRSALSCIDKTGSNTVAEYFNGQLIVRMI